MPIRKQSTHTRSIPRSYRIRALGRVYASRCASAAVIVAAVVSCSEPTAPPSEPPYLAIVMHLSTLPGVNPPARIAYHIKELSGTLNIDRVIEASPTDTVILPVPPATYVITAQDIPATCLVRDGNQRAIVLTDQDNTGIIRYVIQCRGALTIIAETDGYDPDNAFIYQLQSDTGYERLATLGANDTAVVEGLAAGNYSLRLAGIAPNCVVVNDGGRRLSFTLAAAGGTILNFRVLCARESERPRILSLVSSYNLGSSAFAFRVSDPNRDVDGYTWDLTDCQGNSVLPDKRERTRRGLLSGRTRMLDTMTVVGAYDIGLPSSEMQGRCTQIRVFDSQANSSELIEHGIGTGGGQPPHATAFNAQLLGTQFVSTDLSVADPDGDFLGIFVAVRLRDGTLGPTDGNPDVGTMDPAGYLTPVVPNLPLTDRIRWDDVYAVLVWLVDARGNALRLEDADVFH